MAIARLTSFQGGSPDSATWTTSAFSSVGASLICGVLAWDSSATPTISNNHGDTVNLGTVQQSGNKAVAWWIINPTSDSSYTVTFTGTVYSSTCGAVYSGTHASAPFDMENGSITGWPGDVATGNLVPSENNCLLICGCITLSESGTTTSVLTEVEDAILVGGAHYGSSFAEQIQTTATTRNPSVNSSSGTVGVVFKAAPTTYVSDTFTDTDTTTIASHTPDIGGAWSSAAALKISSNTLRADTFTAPISQNDAVTNSADYEVSADIVWNGAAPSEGMVGVAGRAGSGYTAYEAYYEGAGVEQWKLRVYFNGSPTALGSYSHAYVQGQTHRVKLSMVGSAIKVYVDDVERISVTDTVITAARSAGVRFDSLFDSADLYMDNFLAADPEEEEEEPPTIYNFFRGMR